MRKIYIRTSYEFMPDQIKEALSEYALKYFGVYIKPEHITQFDGEDITEIIRGRISAELAEKQSE